MIAPTARDLGRPVDVWFYECGQAEGWQSDRGRLASFDATHALVRYRDRPDDERVRFHDVSWADRMRTPKPPPDRGIAALTILAVVLAIGGFWIAAAVIVEHLR